jgi:four helix bundle protein
MNEEVTKQTNKIRDFTDLFVWQEGHNLVILVYKFLKQFPKKEMYSLTDQMKRAVTSVTSNIAEGFGRQGYKEKIQFYYLAQGSLIELKNQFLIARDVGYLSSKSYEILLQQANKTHQLLQGLLTKTKYFLRSSS